MPTVRELITVLGFDLDDADAKKADTLFKSLTIGAGALVGLVTTAATGLFLLAKQASDVGDKAAKTATKLGITAEEVQELAYAADNSGVAFESLAVGLRFLQRAQAESLRGSKEAQLGFSQLGIRVKDSSGQMKPTVTLLKEVADKLSNVKDPATRTAIAMRLFGRSGADLIPLLIEGGAGIEAFQKRAQLLGHVIDITSAKLAEELNDALTDLGLISKGVGLRIGVGLMPILKRVVDALNLWLISNRVLIDRGINAFVEAVDKAVSAGSRMIELMWEHRIVVLTFIATAMLPLIASYVAWIAVQIKALAIPALMIAAFLALAAVIALVVEDIYVFVTGGQSAIGDLRDAFMKAAQEPGAHWIVRTLAAILEGTTNAISATDTFFREFAKDVDTLGVGGALEGLFDTAIDTWTEKLKGFVVFVLKELFPGLGTSLDVFAFVGEQVGKAQAFIVGLFQKLDSLIAGVREHFVAFYEELGDGVEKLQSKITDAISSSIQRLIARWTEVLQDLYEAYNANVPLPLRLATGTADPIAGATKNLVGRQDAPTFATLPWEPSEPTTNVDIGGARIDVKVEGTASDTVSDIVRGVGEGVKEAFKEAGDQISARFRGRR